MKVLVSGSTGLIGAALVRRLTELGHQVIRLVRSGGGPHSDEVAWDPAADWIDRSALEAAAVEAVVHLAGENIGAGRWTAQKKARIRNSRIHGTALLAQALSALSSPPRVLASASAIGFYGNRGNEELDESSPAGSGFLPELCRDWEAAAQSAAETGIRVVNLRFGLVLAAYGGALARMLPMFRLGLGGPLGSGRQYVSWITLDDAVAAIAALVDNFPLQGPVNLVAPQPVTSREFARALGRALRRPAILPAPSFLLRLLLGEMAEATLLSSTRAVPRRLLESGFSFRDPALQSGLCRLLGRA